MAKTSVRRSSEPRGESVPFRQLLDTLQRQVPFGEAVITTSLPRGWLQIVQPARVSELLLKDYAREFHLHDRLTWQSILGGRAISESDAWKKAEESTYVGGFLVAHGYRHAGAAPLRAPVLEGYPGAVHLYRHAEQGPFLASELQKLQSFARQLDQAIERVRASRPVSAVCRADTALTTRPKVRQFLFDGELRELYAGGEFEQLDAHLREEMEQYARRQVENLNGEISRGDRVKLPDAHGDLWTFRVVIYREYPAVGEGPFVLFCMAPTCGEWSVVRPADFQADTELSRLVPAMRFMKQEYRRGPNLGEISEMVHLSAFHFHRRFTELLGLTPKHYMLECQIHDAKMSLLARKKSLKQIAKECGFAHQSHFTSRFKQATGLTPTRWRRAALAARTK